ncbi:hypothetical protein KPH14_003009 [Odynerus spinipes]|uniref:Uncharacterized protein n=1 Tax=Odynerus spinipes TaxID=1348599 RepID=A0AAD9VUB0_9HYME|nr:hypothetical protein KPH14_003009 [Odynerus spinipes]
MADEHSRAVSFANCYFALVDGLASGLENHLAEDVVLDWFGRTIRGKRNVSTFIRTHKVNSRHMFASIKPTGGIGYKNNHRNRKQDLSNFNEKKRTKVANEICESSNADQEKNEIDWREAPKEDDMTYVLNEGDLCNLFKLYITQTDIEEIEESINRVKLEEEMAPMIGLVKREHGLEEEEEEEEEDKDEPSVDKNSSEIKYIEAVGHVKFSRKYWRKDIYNRYNTVSLDNHTWNRPCKLQVAYSALKERRASISSTDNVPRSRPTSESKSFQEQHNKLLSLEEITSLSNRLVPNVNDFGGYLKTFDFYSDREFFLESLRNELSGKKGNTFLTGYVHNKLIFNRPTTNLACDDSNNNENTKESVNFVFNYRIHVIIYENEHESRDNPHREYEKHV